jgi:gluconate kinase
MGVVGVGKSTLVARLSKLMPQATVFAEWPEAMAPDVENRPEVLTPERQEDIQRWIFAQVARKNAAVSAATSPLVLIDRSPLDTFAFYPRKEWPTRARELCSALAAHEPTLPLASGELLFVQGDGTEIASRMDATRGYMAATLTAQQDAFAELLEWLEQQYGTRVLRLSAARKNPELLATEAAAILGDASSYHSIPLQAVLKDLAAGRHFE